jgi:hypothetical protein
VRVNHANGVYTNPILPHSTEPLREIGGLCQVSARDLKSLDRGICDLELLDYANAAIKKPLFICCVVGLPTAVKSTRQEAALGLR